MVQGADCRRCYRCRHLRPCLCAVTFELSGRRQQATKPGLAKMYRVPPARAWWLAVGPRLERIRRDFPPFRTGAEAPRLSCVYQPETEKGEGLVEGLGISARLEIAKLWAREANCLLATAVAVAVPRVCGAARAICMALCALRGGQRAMALKECSASCCLLWTPCPPQEHSSRGWVQSVTWQK